jgi:hypothetical protein
LIYLNVAAALLFMLKAFVVVQCRKKVRYSTDRIMKRRADLVLADFVIEVPSQASRTPKAADNQGGGNLRCKVLISRIGR